MVIEHFRGTKRAAAACDLSRWRHCSAAGAAEKSVFRSVLMLAGVSGHVVPLKRLIKGAESTLTCILFIF